MLAEKLKRRVPREIEGQQIEVVPLTVRQMLEVGVLDNAGWVELLGRNVFVGGNPIGSDDVLNLETPAFTELQAIVLQASRPDQKRLEALQGNSSGQN